MNSTPKNQPETALVEIPLNQHKQTALHFLKLIETGNIEQAYRMYTASNGRHHNPHFGGGFPALQMGMQESHVQFPNMRLSVKHVIGEGDMVAVHSHVVLRPGETGVAAVHIFRFEGDKIVEFWDCSEPVPADSPNPDGMF